MTTLSRILSLLIVSIAFYLFLLTDRLSLPFEDFGATIYQHYKYGEWVAQKDALVYQDRTASAPVAFKVSPHEKVDVLAGVVVTTELGIAEVSKSETINGVTVAAGTNVFILTPGEHSCVKVWRKGWPNPPTDEYLAGRNWKYPVYMCNLQIQKKQISTRWIKIKNKRGNVGWAHPDAFSPYDAMLLDAIQDTSIPLKDKLKRIDKMVSLGADININGPNGPNDEPPAETAILTKDFNLIRELLDRGLLLNPPNRCLADTQFHRLKSDEDIAMVRFLLDHGMKTDCLDPAKVYSPVMFGCASNDYDVAQVMRVAKFLMSFGFDPNAKDRFGKSIFDLPGFGDEQSGERSAEVQRLRNLCQENISPVFNAMQGQNRSFPH